MKSIAFLGRTNAGKSTLINCLTNNQIAAISDKVHTTRIPLQGILQHKNEKWMLLDAPGLCRPRSVLDKIMFQNLVRVVENSNLVWLVVDIEEHWGPDMEILLDLIKKKSKPVVLVINKTDLTTPEKIMQKIQNWKDFYSFEAIVPISAKKKHNIVNLIEATEKNLSNIKESSLKMQNSSLLEISKEIIREQILLQTNEEIPHQTALMLEKKQSTVSGYILFWKIIVNRNSQKIILLGKKGSKIANIRKMSEIKLSQIWKQEIVLSFFIEVEHKWFQNKIILQKLKFEWEKT